MWRSHDVRQHKCASTTPCSVNAPDPKLGTPPRGRPGTQSLANSCQHHRRRSVAIPCTRPYGRKKLAIASRTSISGSTTAVTCQRFRSRSRAADRKVSSGGLLHELSTCHRLSRAVMMLGPPSEIENGGIALTRMARFRRAPGVEARRAPAFRGPRCGALHSVVVSENW